PPSLGARSGCSPRQLRARVLSDPWARDRPLELSKRSRRARVEPHSTGAFPARSPPTPTGRVRNALRGSTNLERAWVPFHPPRVGWRVAIVGARTVRSEFDSARWRRIDSASPRTSMSSTTADAAAAAWRDNPAKLEL